MATIIRWHGERLTEHVGRRVGAALRSTGLQMVHDIQVGMTETPRHPTRMGAKGPVSMPGSPPAVQESHLRPAIEMDASELDEGLIHVGATGAAPYAIYMELGTSTIEPRPFLRPALDRVEGPLHEALRGILD